MHNRRTFAKSLGVMTCAATTARGTVLNSDQIKVGVITQLNGPHIVAYLEALRDTVEVGSVVIAVEDKATQELAESVLGSKLVEAFNSYEKLLQNHHPEMALVSLEARLAPAAVKAAIEHDCHVFAEKPSCVRIEDFRDLAILAETKQRHLMLALANRMNEEVTKARSLIQEGKIGRVFGVEMHLIADQTRLTQPSYRDTWYAFKDRAGGGHLIWLGIHWLDLAMFVTGTSIVKVSAMAANVGGQPIEVEDSAVLNLQFDNGALGTMTSGYYLDSGKQSHIKIWGSRGWLEIRSHGDQPLIWYSQLEKEAGIQSTNTGHKPSSYTPLVRACIRSAAGLQDPPLTTADSLRVLETVFAAYRSAETGCVQSVGKQ